MNYQTPSIDYNDEIKSDLENLEQIIDSINERRDSGISQNLLHQLRTRLKISHVFHSNAIEGNNLSLRETELILNGMVINERPLKDEIEARALSAATEYLYSLIEGSEPLTKRTLLELHGLIIDKTIDEQSGRFRRNDVQIKGSEHTPPGHLDVESHIDSLFMWMNRNIHRYRPVEMAAILHHWLTWIHPFNDGNGRVSRLFLNFFLLQKGYPEVVIRIGDRDEYYNSLINADRGDILGLVELLISNILVSAKQYEELFNEDERQKQWQKELKSVASEEYEKARKKQSFDYEVWKNNILNFKQIIEKNLDYLEENMGFIECSFKDYEILSFNQYLDLLEDRKVSNTWYFNFRLVNRLTGKRVNLLFYFERWKRSIPLQMLGVNVKDSEGRSRRHTKGRPFIKLWITTRVDGHSVHLAPEISLRNIGTYKDSLSFGVQRPVTREDGTTTKRIYNIHESHGSLVRQFLNEIVTCYLND